jgi:hypothetical protein
MFLSGVDAIIFILEINIRSYSLRTTIRWLDGSPIRSKKNVNIQKAKHSISEALQQLGWLDKLLEGAKPEGMARAVNIMRWELKQAERMLDNELNAGKPTKTMRCSWCRTVLEVRDVKIVWKGGVTRRTQYNQSPFYYFKCERCGEENYEKC